MEVGNGGQLCSMALVGAPGRKWWRAADAKEEEESGNNNDNKGMQTLTKDPTQFTQINL